MEGWWAEAAGTGGFEGLCAGATERLGAGKALATKAVRALCKGASSEGEIETVLDLARRNRTQLAVRRHFKKLNANVGAALVQSCGEAGAFGLLPRILRESSDLGLTVSDRAIGRALNAAAAQGEALAVARAFRAVVEEGRTVSPRLGHSFVRASFDAGRKDLAEAIAEECEQNGVPLRPATRRMLASKEAPSGATGGDGDGGGGGGGGGMRLPRRRGRREQPAGWARQKFGQPYYKIYTKR